MDGAGGWRRAVGLFRPHQNSLKWQKKWFVWSVCFALTKFIRIRLILIRVDCRIYIYIIHISHAKCQFSSDDFLYSYKIGITIQYFICDEKKERKWEKNKKKSHHIHKYILHNNNSQSRPIMFHFEWLRGNSFEVSFCFHPTIVRTMKRWRLPSSMLPPSIDMNWIGYLRPWHL